jgi:hypothetical protein
VDAVSLFSLSCATSISVESAAFCVPYNANPGAFDESGLHRRQEKNKKCYEIKRRNEKILSRFIQFNQWDLCHLVCVSNDPQHEPLRWYRWSHVSGLKHQKKMRCAKRNTLGSQHNNNPPPPPSKKKINK